MATRWGQGARRFVRRLAMIVSALAVVSAVRATAYLLTTDAYRVVVSEGVVEGTRVAPSESTQTLAEVNGSWVVGLLVAVTALSALPLVIAVLAPAYHVSGTWIPALLLLAFSVVAGFSVGGFYMQSALLLVASGVVALLAREREAGVTSVSRAPDPEAE